MQPPPLSKAVLAAMVAMVIVASGVLLGLASYTDYTETLDRAEDNAETVARLTEEHIQGIIAASNATLLRLADLVRRADLGVLSGSPEAWRHVQEMAEALPRSGNLWVFDTRGDTVLTSVRFPAPTVNVAHFHTFAEALRSPRAVISEAVKGRITGTHYFAVVRAVRDAAGAPIAVISAAIESDYFTQVYASVNLGPDAAIAVFNDEAQLLLRYPPLNDPELGRRFTDAAFYGMAKVFPHGTYRMTSVLDGIDRIFAYRRLADRPLIVLAAVSVDAVLDDWRDRLLRNTLVTALVAAALLAAASYAYRLLRREEANREALERAVADLERNRQALNRAVAEKEAERERADDANAAKSRFLAAASHDLRQPLQAVTLFIELLANTTEGKPREVADKAREAMNSSRALLDSLLDLSILEAGTQRVAKSEFPLCGVLGSLADEFEAQFGAHGITFRHVRCRAVVYSDAVLLKRILRNLLVNALRYTPSGRVLLGCRRAGESVRLEVWDTGPGIPENRLNDIFKEYVRLDEHAEGPIKGLGLGLSIVAKTAQLLDLRVGVRSRQRKGSVFSVTVPLAASPPCRDVPHQTR